MSKKNPNYVTPGSNPELYPRDENGLLQPRDTRFKRTPQPGKPACSAKSEYVGPLLKVVDQVSGAVTEIVPPLATATETELKRAMEAAVSTQDMTDIMKELVTRAKQGQHQCAAIVLDRLFGKAIARDVIVDLTPAGDSPEVKEFISKLASKYEGTS